MIIKIERMEENSNGVYTISCENNKRFLIGGNGAYGLCIKGDQAAITVLSNFPKGFDLGFLEVSEYVGFTEVNLTLALLLLLESHVTWDAIYKKVFRR